jgi:hypothetical protein
MPHDRLEHPILHRYSVIVQVVGGALAFAALWTAVCSATAANRNANNSAVSAKQAWRMFQVARRPWLKTRADNVGGSPAKRTLDYQAFAVCYGTSPIDWNYGGKMQLNTRQPIADLRAFGVKELTSQTLFPGDTSFFVPGHETLICGRSDRPDAFYMHAWFLYGGAETQDTYYTEHVFYANAEFKPEAHSLVPWFASERAYQGIVKQGKIILSDYGTIDFAARDSALAWIDLHLQNLAGIAPNRTTAAVCSLLLTAGFDSTTADYAAARVELERRKYIIDARRSADSLAQSQKPAK